MIAVELVTAGRLTWRGAAVTDGNPVASSWPFVSLPSGH